MHDGTVNLELNDQSTFRYLRKAKEMCTKIISQLVKHQVIVNYQTNYIKGLGLRWIFSSNNNNKPTSAWVLKSNITLKVSYAHCGGGGVKHFTWCHSEFSQVV